MTSDLDREGDFLRRGERGFAGAGRPAGRSPMSQEQEIPVNLYETENDLVIVAPMPGVEAENIDIEVVGTTLTLRASLRGPGQENRRYRLHEWSYGPYLRTIQLPYEVDADRANATHDNGVLGLTLPKALSGRAIHIPLKREAGTGAIHRGHSGRPESGRGAEDDESRD